MPALIDHPHFSVLDKVNQGRSRKNKYVMKCINTPQSKFINWDVVMRKFICHKSTKKYAQPTSQKLFKI